MQKNIEKQKGSALFFVIVILSIMVSALLVLATLSVSQIKGMSALSDSVIAFYAADTGIERSIYRLVKSPTWYPSTNELVYPDDVVPLTCPSIMWRTFGEGDKVEYQVCVDSANELIFRSTGNYKTTNTKRKIEIKLD